MKDTIYQYDAYSPKYDENYIINSDTPIRLGLWVTDDGSMVQVKKFHKVLVTSKPKPAYQPTNTIEYTIYPELTLLLITLFAIAILIRWIWGMRKK